MPTNRRDWLKQSTLAAFGLGLGLRSMAGEDYLPRTFGKESGLLNLGSNENPYGVSPKAREAIIDMINLGHRYQYNVPMAQSFKKELADYYGVSAEQVLLTPGSGEGLVLLARYFTKGNIISATPTFPTLPNNAKKLGTQVTEVALTKDKVHDLPAMLAAINNNTQLVYIVNPANPTATIVKPGELKSFCVEAGKKAVVLIDEAYIDYLNPPDNESMLGLIENNPNILVMRTFSKIHAMAGIRLGFIAGHPSLIKKLETSLFSNTNFCVSILAMASASTSLKDEAHQKMSRQKNEAVRNYTIKSLQQMGIQPIPSYTNFLIMPLGNYAGDFAQDMLKQNVVLRSYTYPDGKWARVSIGTMQEMQQFISLLKSMWKQA